MYYGSVNYRTQDGFSLEEMLIMDLVLAEIEDLGRRRHNGRVRDALAHQVLLILLS